jgi:acyl carrier protein
MKIDRITFLHHFKEVLEIQDKEVTLSEPFRELDSWDSLALLSVIAMIDDEYDVIIKGNQFKELKTLEEVIQYIENQS